ncbi:hypothetical protein V2J09_017796 [Rumex salicifolius]
MECNKEEAVRAKEIAQKKMENQDFAGARKIAMKSQRLYPDLENIGQIICVCDVHCSAENKKLGNERDWYDILKVEQSADELSIKKQYRKLALLLHPDKNKFSGAEAAFMLIGEAQKVLLDKEKRSIYDARYRRFFQSTAPNPSQENRNSKNVKPSSSKNNMTKNSGTHVKKQPQQQAHPLDPSGIESFWTVCPFCSIRYRYRMTALNKNLTCQSCKKAFIGYDICDNSTPTGSKVNQTNTGTQTGVFNQGMSSSASKAGFQANSGQHPSGSNANQAAACAQGVSNKSRSSGTSNGRFQGNPGQQKSGVDAFAKSGPSTHPGKSNKTNELNTGAKNISRSGGSNRTRTNFGKRDKNQATVEKACDTVGKREKKQAAVEKAGDTVGTTEKKQASVERAGDTVAKREKQVSAEKAGDRVAKRVKKEVIDSLAKSGGSSQSKGCTGPEDIAVEKGGGASAGSRPSSESKRRVSDTEMGSGEETLNSIKRFKGNAESSPLRKSPPKVGSTKFRKPPDIADGNARNGKDKVNENHCVKESDLQRSSKVVKPDSSVNDSAKMQMQDVPDNDFNDFEQIRKESNFKVNQIWAAYDTVDAMPRFYAIIKRVYSPGFKLRITWLEPDPDEKDARCWANNDLPFSCGKFVLQHSETTEDLLMFSQSMCWEKGDGKGSIIIYPKKGETWALFRDWHVDWMSNPHNSRKFECEFVEILSDYDGSVGIRVAVLGKLKGFSSLFCRKGRDEIHIPPSEYLRFSHRVPSYRMTGEEGEAVPKGSFELDPASIPLENLTGEDIPLTEEMKLEKATGHSSVSDSELQGGNPGVMLKEKESGIENDQTKTHDNLQSTSDDVAKHLVTEASTLEPCELPEPEFFNFDATRDLGRFQVGQVWALYSDTDGLPKYYGQIKRVCLDSPMKLKIAWLEAYSRSNDLILWRNKEMPICCGKFKITEPKLQCYIDSSPFSHELEADTIKLNVFEIYPQIGQIWALYKNWNVDMAPSDLENCDYDVVEILEQSIKGSPTKVLVLEQVSGYNSVFKVGSSLSTMKIPYNELLRFSHQIPAHALTEEKEGSLRGFKELDPSALPATFFLPKVK